MDIERLFINIMYDYLYIFDYTTVSITEIELSDEDKELEAEDILSKYNFDSDNCAWMFSPNKLEIDTII